MECRTFSLFRGITCSVLPNYRLCRGQTHGALPTPDCGCFAWPYLGLRKYHPSGVSDFFRNIQKKINK